MRCACGANSYLRLTWRRGNAEVRKTEAGDWRKASLLLVQYRVPSLVGLALVLWSFSLYVSCENRPVLARWSYEFAGVFLSLTLAWIGYLWYAVRRGKSPITKSTARRVALTGLVNRAVQHSRRERPA